MMMFLSLTLLTLAASVWNARVCGQFWEGSNRAAARALWWSGAVLSATGFSLIYAFVGGVMVGVAMGDLGQSSKMLQILLSLQTLAAFVPEVIAGGFVTICLYVAACQSREGVTIGLAGFNTFVLGQKIWSMAPLKAFDMLSFEGVESGAIVLALCALGVAVVASILTTDHIIRRAKEKGGANFQRVWLFIPL